MGLRQFFSLRNEHTLAIMFLVPMIAAFAVSQINSNYTLYVAGPGIGMIIVFMIYTEAHAYIQGPKNPHLKLIQCEYPIGAAREQDFYIDRADPAGKFPAIWPLLSYYCKTCRSSFVDDQINVSLLVDVDTGLKKEIRMCPKCKTRLSNKVPWIYFGGRSWWPVLIRAKWPIETPGYEGGISLHGFVLSHPYEKYFNFAKREYGAYLTGTEYTHPSSDICVTIVAPFKTSYIGVEIPIHLAVFATGAPMKQITKDWGAPMNELARYLSKDNMSKLLDDYKDEIFPAKQFDEMIAMHYQSVEEKKKEKQLNPPPTVK